MPTRNTITEAIEAVLNEFRFDDHVTPASINRRECEPFAKAVNEHLDDELEIRTTAKITGGDPNERPEPWHVWLTDGEYHYDAECPEGVETWGQIPFFERTLNKTGGDIHNDWR